MRTKKATTKVIFTFTSSEKSPRFSCKLDKKKWQSYSSRATYKVKRGKHTLLVRATDRAGNTDSTPAKWAWKVKRSWENELAELGSIEESVPVPLVASAVVFYDRAASESMRTSAGKGPRT